MKANAAWPAMMVAWAGLHAAAAAELFVDQKHPEAGDQNPGTEAKPFKTIQPAVDKAQPGDTIYVKTARETGAAARGQSVKEQP